MFLSEAIFLFYFEIKKFEKRIEGLLPLMNEINN